MHWYLAWYRKLSCQANQHIVRYVKDISAWELRIEDLSWYRAQFSLKRGKHGNKQIDRSKSPRSKWDGCREPDCGKAWKQKGLCYAQRREGISGKEDKMCRGMEIWRDTWEAPCGLSLGLQWEVEGKGNWNRLTSWGGLYPDKGTGFWRAASGKSETTGKI